MTEQQLVWLTDYIQETNPYCSLRELWEQLNFLSIYDSDKEEVGMVGYSLMRSDNYGLVALIKLIYIIPEVRGNFEQWIPQLHDKFRAMGCKFVEVYSNGGLSRILTKYYRVPPHIYVHTIDLGVE